MWAVWYERNGNRLSEDWWVPNRVAESLLDMLRSIGPDLAKTEEQRRWITKVQDENRGCWYVNGFNIAEVFESADEMDFWSQACFELARRMCQQPPADFDVDSQVTWIWAAFDLQRVLSMAASKMREESKK